MTIIDLLKRILAPDTRRRLRRWQRRIERLLRRLRSRRNIGSLRRTTPVSELGADRGQIIDRYYIEQFLTTHKDDVRGHVLEFSDDSYARSFGGTRLTQVDVLEATSGNPAATIVAVLEQAPQIPADTFDCIICTQVLQFVYDLRAGVRTLYRILKPGGVLLLTAPGIQKIDREGMDAWGEYWRFTSLALRRLFAEVFPEDQIMVRAYGNVLTAAAFLYGYAVEDLRRQDLDYFDPDYEGPIGLRAVKPRRAQS
jgi:SAM-dependent methyltransferase